MILGSSMKESVYMPMASWIPTGPFYKNMKYRCWFWKEHLAELFDIYQKTVRGKASLMLNLSPDTRELIPDEAVEQIQGLAKFMGRRTKRLEDECDLLPF